MFKSLKDLWYFKGSEWYFINKLEPLPLKTDWATLELSMNNYLFKDYSWDKIKEWLKIND